MLSPDDRFVVASPPYHRRVQMPSAPSEDSAPSARLVAQLAPTEPRAQPEPLEGLPWPQELASGRPILEHFFHVQPPGTRASASPSSTWCSSHPTSRTARVARSASACPPTRPGTWRRSSTRRACTRGCVFGAPLPRPLTNPACAAVHAQWDLDGDGQLSQDEFRSGVAASGGVVAALSPLLHELEQQDAAEAKEAEPQSGGGPEEAGGVWGRQLAF